MRNNWEIVKLGNLIKHRIGFISIDDFHNYKLCRVQTKVQGVVLREEKQGFEIKTKKQQFCKTDDLIFAEMDARFGGYGIIPAELDGAIVSSHYFLYEINHSELEKKYLEYCLTQPWFLAQVEAKGSTNYAAIRPYQVLEYEIPLPPLAEQKRIVEKIESVQKRIEQIRKVRAEQEKEINNLKYSIFEKLLSEFGSTNIGTFIEENIDSVLVNQTQQYQFAGVYCFGKGLFVRGLQNGNDTTYKTFNRLHENQLVMSQPKGWEGAIALVSKDFDNLFLSPVYSTFTAKDNNNIKFVSEFCKLPTTWQKMLDVSKGIGARRNSIYAKDFLKIEIPNVPISEQNRIVSFLEKTNQIRQTFKTQEAELTDLLPSLLDKAFKGELFVETKQALTVKNNKLESNYFVKRKMLGVYIINQSLSDNKFGDTKFEKIMHLVEYWAIKRNFNQQYHKQAAGPYDNRFTFGFYDQITKAGWFDIQKIPNSQSKITAGKNNDKSQKNYNYFSAEELEKVNLLLDFFKKSDYKVPEVVSTLYAVWNNRIILQQEISDKMLIQDFYDWNKHKEVYTKAQVENSLKWMREKNIVPDGWGKVIEGVKKR